MITAARKSRGARSTATRKTPHAPILHRSTPELIATKRDGNALSPAEIAHLIGAYTSGEVTDYQMAAFAMAVFFRGMSDAETTALTLAMRDSGLVVDLSKVRGPKVDKHSTGGVGDKVSLCLAPLVAACGVNVPMVSGRGLGHTGGTLDKLEAIPGFSVDMPVDAFVRQVRDVGCALIGQTTELAPADKRLYALRDVTATVESIPLITASILSKKLAEGIDSLVLDVKVGRGAFMKTREDARALARSIVRVGKLAKKRVSAVLTSMEAPLGRTIGNALETREALEVLHGAGPSDLVECTLVLGAEMLRLAGVAKSDAAAVAMLRAAIADGRGRERMRRIIRAQGGDPRVVDEPDRLPRAPHRVVLRAPANGVVAAIDPLELGLVSVALGAGRTRKEDVIDPAVGIVIDAPVGTRVRKGAALATLHVASPDVDPELSARARDAFDVRARASRSTPLVLEVIRS